jgi:hypothetical protein
VRHELQALWPRPPLDAAGRPATAQLLGTPPAPRPPHEAASEVQGVLLGALDRARMTLFKLDVTAHQLVLYLRGFVAPAAALRAEVAPAVALLPFVWRAQINAAASEHCA